MFNRIRAIPKPIELLNLLGASAVFVILLIIPPPAYISQVLGRPGWLILLLLFGFFAVLLRQKEALWEGFQSALCLPFLQSPDL